MSGLLPIAACTLLLDQVSKFLVILFLPEGESRVIVPGVLYLTHVRNYGAAFGIMSNRTAFFVFVTIAVITLIIVAHRRLAVGRRLLSWGLALQLGGAVGNLIDRLRTGCVTDFIDLRVWPVFNLADVAIVAGVVLLCWELLHCAPEGGSESGRLG
ncbi:MAG: signal peptidase II [Clostridia bacterium]|nr:signal peptidase II [Clostridia bacterium]